MSGVRGDNPSGGGRVSPATGAGNETVEFAFGAAFASIRAVRIRDRDGDAPIRVHELLPDDSGRFWIVNDERSSIRIFSQQGRCLRVLEAVGTRVRTPTSLAHVHERWIAVLDGKLPAVAVLDERGETVRRFALPELDNPLQLRNLGDRLLAITGSGWGRGHGYLVHLYTLAGEYQESLFAEPHDARRVYVATAGSRLYFGQRGGDSFSIYDVEARSILSFPSHASDAHDQRPEVDGPLNGDRLTGLFATRCGILLAVYREERSSAFVYDVYGLDGSTLATRLRMPERVVGVEGPLFYSVRRDDEGLILHVWKLKAWKDWQRGSE